MKLLDRIAGVLGRSWVHVPFTIVCVACSCWNALVAPELVWRAVNVLGVACWSFVLGAHLALRAKRIEDPALRLAGGGLWDRMTAPFGRRNALDRLVEVVGLHRRRGRHLWETNGSLRDRAREVFKPREISLVNTPPGVVLWP